MSISARWWKFTHRMIEYEKDQPGVYELGDMNGEVVYIGCAEDVKRRLFEHFHEPASGCLKQNTLQFRVEYNPDYQRRVREVYQKHLLAHGEPPKCNLAGPSAV